MVQKVSILGSTGSIGTQALEVCSQFNIPVHALACSKNIDLLYRQIQLFKPEFVAVHDVIMAKNLQDRLAEASSDYRCPVYAGDEGILAAAEDPQADMVLAAMVGLEGIKYVVAAIKSGHDIAFANKEVLVAAGDLVNELIAEHQVRLLPVDSEHSAVWQCLQTGRAEELRRIILTASGGPFRGQSRESLASVTPEMALRHPTWSMGQKISIDSATMMNKGLEIIEAAKLFSLRSDQIDVLIHPQSIVHSMVEWQDGSLIAQMSEPDMRLPIQLAFSWPDRWNAPQRRLDLFEAANRTLTFESVDRTVFTAIDLAYAALETGGTMPLVLNSSNEIAVEAFLSGRLSFLGISETVERCMDLHVSKGFISKPKLDDMITTDFEIRRLTKEIIGWIE